MVILFLYPVREESGHSAAWFCRAARLSLAVKTIDPRLMD